uniref:zinc finger protein 813-like n=1 Tax=Styela clava TaxID=7725 RepID=UPI0019393AEA|nr:zinc finger protein 813-like [Styela clava]
MSSKLPKCLDIRKADSSKSQSIFQTNQEWGFFCDDSGRVIVQCMSKVAEGLETKEEENSSNNDDEEIFGLLDTDEEFALNEFNCEKQDRPEMVLLVSTDQSETQSMPSSPELPQTPEEMFSSDLETNYCRTRTWVEKQEDIGESILSQQNLQYGLSDDVDQISTQAYLYPLAPDHESERISTINQENFPCVKTEWYIRKPANESSLSDDVAIVNTNMLAMDMRQFLKHHGISMNNFAKQYLNRTQGTLSDLLNHPKQWEDLSKKGKEIYISLIKFLSSPNLFNLVSKMARKNVRSNSKRIPDCIMNSIAMGSIPSEAMLTAAAVQLNLSFSYIRHYCNEQIKIRDCKLMESSDGVKNKTNMFISNEIPDKDTNDENLEKATDHLTVGSNCIFPKFLEQHICTQFGCGAILQNKPSLKNHLMCHGGIREHLCRICNERFSTKYNLNCHIKTHSRPAKVSEKAKERLSAVKDQMSRYICGICWIRCKSRNCLIKHLLQHGIVKENVRIGFTCYVCVKNFKTLYALKIHMRIHTNTRPFQCEQCDMGFQTKANLQRHIRKHTGEKPFACSICPARFAEAKCVTIHMRTHTGEKPFICPICNKRFSQNSPLQAHMLIHKNEKPHLCDLCGSSFRQKGNLRMHVLRHRGVKNRKCHICGMSFLTKSDFDRHYLKHTGERLFQCEHCKKAFTRLSYLQEHMKKLQGPSAPQCQTCRKKFCDENSRKKHAKQHHDFIQNEPVREQDQMDKLSSLDPPANNSTLFLASKAMFNDEKHYILTAVRPMDNPNPKALIDNCDSKQPNGNNLQSFMLTPADELSSTFPTSEQSILMHLCQEFSISESENRVLPDHILLTSDGNIMTNTRQSHIPISLAPVDEDNLKTQQNMVENSDPNMQSVVVETIEDSSMIISQSGGHESGLNQHIKLNDTISPCQVVVPSISSDSGIVISDIGERNHVEMCSDGLSPNNVNSNVSNECVILSHPIENEDQTNELAKSQTYIIVDLELDT